jgi:hypothetical protein
MMASLVTLAKIIRGNQNVLLINPIVFGLHIVSFTLFIFAFLIFDIFYSRSLVNWTTKSAKESSFTNAFATAFGFISEAIFMHILNAYSQVKNEVFIAIDRHGKISVSPNVIDTEAEMPIKSNLQEEDVESSVA